MQQFTIGQVSRTYAISTRALRYYETLGLLSSEKREGYAYRLYSEDALVRLRQILLLRKLRIPLLTIKEILERDDLSYAVGVFEEGLRSLDEEIGALGAVRTLLELLIDRLRQDVQVRVRDGLLTDALLLEMAESLPPSARKLKEEIAMNELDKAQDTLGKLTDRDVRIIYLPPMTVASIHVQKGLGISEDECHAQLDAFVREHKLTEIKPDIRHFGFNHPDGNPHGEPEHGYEMWVTIPEDMDVPAPYQKLCFPGGMYAAHMIPMGSFEEWEWLFNWIGRSERFAFDDARNDPERMNGMMEEGLNYVHYFERGEGLVQLDLLLPVKPKA